MKTQEKCWRRGWDSNSVVQLNRRKLLILLAAKTATTANLAQVGYSSGTDFLPTSSLGRESTKTPADSRSALSANPRTTPGDRGARETAAFGASRRSSGETAAQYTLCCTQRADGDDF